MKIEGKAHIHIFSDHPNPEWVKTHVTCIICGLSLPLHLLPAAISQGAKRITKNITED